MLGKTTLFVFLIVALFIHGCSNEYKKEVLKKELKKEFNDLTKKVPEQSAIKIIEVNAENFKVTKNIIPDNEQIKRIKILGAPLDDVIALLSEATDQDIIFQTQSQNHSNQINNNNQINSSNPYGNSVRGRNTNNNNNNNNNNDNNLEVGNLETGTANVFLSASNIGFGKLLKKTVGDKLSINYDDGTYYLGYVKTVTLKIPSITELATQMKNTLTTLGALNVVQDSVTSTVTFSAREKEYQDIMKYLTILRNNLYVIEYDIAIYDVDLNDNYNLGIDWSLVPTGARNLEFTSQTSSSFGAAGAAAGVSAMFGTLLNNKYFSASMIGEALTKFGTVESIQKPKLLGIAGTDVTLIDGQSEQYISGLTTTAVGDTGIQTTTQNKTAQSGLQITLNSNIMDGTVITDINLVVNDIVGYTDFSVGDTSYTQPKVRTKTITNNIRVQPGVPIVISGLFRHKKDKGYKGIPGLAQTDARILGGSEYTSMSKSEMVIIVTPRVIKYVMK